MAWFSLKKLAGEFRDFAFKGNMIDLAIAVVVGKAVGDLIQSIVAHIITPLITFVSSKHVPGQPSINYRDWHLGPLEIGPVISDLLNFIIVTATIFFLVVKLISVVSKLTNRKKALAEAAAPTTKECSFCCSTIPIKATRCSACTSTLEAAGPAAAT